MDPGSDPGCAVLRIGTHKWFLELPDMDPGTDPGAPLGGLALKRPAALTRIIILIRSQGGSDPEPPEA